MEAAATQLNTRIPARLKEQGDEVLARQGMTASEVIRSVWTYMAMHQDVPDFAKPGGGDRSALVREKMRLLDEGAAAFADCCNSLGISQFGEGALSPEQERDALADELLAEYEAIHA